MSIIDGAVAVITILTISSISLNFSWMILWQSAVVRKRPKARSGWEMKDCLLQAKFLEETFVIVWQKSWNISFFPDSLPLYGNVQTYLLAPPPSFTSADKSVKNVFENSGLLKWILALVITYHRQCPAGTRTRPATRYFFRYPTRPDSVLEIIG